MNAQRNRNGTRCKGRRFGSGWARGMIVSVGLLLSSACGSRLQDRLGGETGFLRACGSDAECQSGLCACGVCTRECSDVSQCHGGRAVCAAEVNGNECTSTGRSVCVPTDDTNTNDNDASVTSGATNSDLTTTSKEECTSVLCDDEVTATSPGQVELHVEVEGATCPVGCGGHVLSLFRGRAREPIVTDMLQCGDECPLPPPPVCTEPSTEPLIWDGRINFAGGSQTCESLGGGSVPCETEARYLLPGRYTVNVCLGLLDALGCTESCRDEEFDFPSTEPVIVRWMNNSTNGPAIDTTEDNPRRPTETSASTGDAGAPTDNTSPRGGGAPTDDL